MKVKFGEFDEDVDDGLTVMFEEECDVGMMNEDLMW